MSLSTIVQRIAFRFAFAAQAEFKTGADRKEAAEHTLLAYKAAQVRESRLGLRWRRPFRSLTRTSPPPGHCLGGAPTHPPHPAGPGAQLLGVLLRDPELARARVQPGEAGAVREQRSGACMAVRLHAWRAWQRTRHASMCSHGVLRGVPNAFRDNGWVAACRLQRGVLGGLAEAGQGQQAGGDCHLCCLCNACCRPLTRPSRSSTPCPRTRTRTAP